jgi:hypothetical protein
MSADKAHLGRKGQKTQILSRSNTDSTQQNCTKKQTYTSRSRTTTTTTRQRIRILYNSQKNGARKKNTTQPNSKVARRNGSARPSHPKTQKTRIQSYEKLGSTPTQPDSSSANGHEGEQARARNGNSANLRRLLPLARGGGDEFHGW